ncbi:hypothetical protein TNCV_2642041, partial [Trichonephila clavipes]
METKTKTFELVEEKQKLLDIRAEKREAEKEERERFSSVSMEIPLRTAYSQNGRCGMQPKAYISLLRAGALNKLKLKTFELVEEKQNSWTLEQKKREAEKRRTRE